MTIFIIPSKTEKEIFQEDVRNYIDMVWGINDCYSLSKHGGTARKRDLEYKGN